MQSGTCELSREPRVFRALFHECVRDEQRILGLRKQEMLSRVYYEAPTCKSGDHAGWTIETCQISLLRRGEKVLIEDGNIRLRAKQKVSG